MDIVVDIDGTLADIAHRRHYVASKPKNWKAFERAMHLDGLNADVAWVVRSMWLNDQPRDGWRNEDGYKVRDLLDRPRIILASGRGEQSRGVTKKWLNQNFIFPELPDDSEDVYTDYPLFTYHRLYMRAKGDNRSDVIVKEEILTAMRLDGFNPTIAVDDRDGVVEMWRRNGLRCLQVAPGDF